jgi:CheY-like chemotaxis protein
MMANRATKPKLTVTLICWNATEGRERARLLQGTGLQVKLECGQAREGPAILRRLRASPPNALVIDLDRLPMQGRDLGVAIRTSKQTRHVPLVFAGGDSAKVDRVRRMLPDAVYASWAGIVVALKRALAKPNPNPVVPSSNLAGYSGTPLPKKLGIKSNCSIALLNEPENFVEGLGELPSGVQFTNRIVRDITKLGIWFVRSAAELSSKIESVAAALGRAHLWICWAKRTSPLATDVSEQAVRTAGLAAGLVDYKVAAINADWSGLLFAPRRGPTGTGNAK